MEQKVEQMKEITKEKRKHFIEQSKRSAPDGYVSIGFGNEADYLSNYFHKNQIYSGSNTLGFRNNWDGYISYHEYFLPVKIWNEHFRLYLPDGIPQPPAPTTNTPKECSLKEQIDYARNFLGKKIKTARYDKVGIVKGISYIEKADNVTGKLKAEMQEFISNQGLIVCLDVEEAAGIFRPYWVHPILCPIQEHLEKVKVNGYEAEDCGDYFKFGCAKIDKEQLNAAKYLLQSIWPNSNKKVESVKIGTGEFTLEILKKLLG